jgi:clan AA aspartic protease (TIGR02281 family)
MLNRWIGAVAITLLLTECGQGAGAQQDANFSIGQQLYKQGRLPEALKYLNAAAKGSRNPTVFYYEALTLQGLGHLDAAKRVYTDICRYFPQSPEGRLSSKFLSAPGASAIPLDRRSAPIASSQSRSTPSASASSSLPDETKVPFRKSDSGHIFVSCSINNRPMEVLFDTGSSTCLFGKNQFDAAGITPQMTDQKSALMGVGTGTTTTTVGIVNLRLGDITRHMPVMVADNLTTPPLLGQPFFEGYQYDIDNQSGFIHFIKKGARGNEALDSINVPFVMEDNNMKVMGKVNGKQCLMYFDTGAPACLFSKASAESLGLTIPADAQRVMSGGIGGKSLAFQFNVDRIELGGVQKTNQQIVVMETGGPPLPLLGQSFFRDRHYIIDNDAHVIKFMR